MLSVLSVAYRDALDTRQSEIIIRDFIVVFAVITQIEIFPFGRVKVLRCIDEV